LGCGTGRLTIPIAQSGVEIVGADLSTTMLDAARAKARAASVEAHFVQADMRRFHLPGRFSAILIPGNSLLHLLTIDELKDCLLSVRRHLEAGGRLIFDISKWDLARLARDPGERFPVLRWIDPERGEVSIEETGSYDAARQVRAIRWYLSAPGAADFRTIDYCLRVIFPQELPLLLESAGFAIESRFGEFTRETFQSSSPRQVCVCTARE
jgi:SAM-dependent methyltransferase